MEYQPEKEWNSAICKDIDGPRDCCIKWSMSEREKQISFNITYMWNLEKCYRWTYSQSKNRDTDVEHYHGVGEGMMSELRYWDQHIYTVCII